MIDLNYIEVPHSAESDTELEQHTWMNGRCVMENRQTEVVVMLFHKDYVVNSNSMEEKNATKDVTRAFCFSVEKPVTRDKAINAAEMEAYNLHSAMDVASFAASLSRKSRTNETTDEVKEHDDFIEEVKKALTSIGI